MLAIFWDGQRQLKGELLFKKNEVSFQFVDFSNSDLDFALSYADIREVNYLDLYNLVGKGIEIITRKGSKNVFILNNPIKAKHDLEQLLNK